MYHCPKCASADVEAIGYYAIRISIDDIADVSQFICYNCKLEWEM